MHARIHYPHPSSMRWLNLIPFILVAIPAYCQELSYKQYTVKDGLPGSTVYQALEDRKGFIWFATNQGVSRFDGRTFTNFYKEDGLPDNDIIRLYLDRYDNIWFISFIGIPAVLHNGIITAFPACRQVKNVCEDPFTNFITLVTEGNTEKKVLLGSYVSPQIPGKWQFTEYIKGDTQPPFNVSAIRASVAGKIGAYFSIANKNSYELTLKDNTSARRYYFNREKWKGWLPFTVFNFVSFMENKRGILFFTPDFYIYYADMQRMRIIFSPEKTKWCGRVIKNINSIYCENDTTLWICTRDQGLLCVKNFLTTHASIHSFFDKSFCTSIIKDQERGYWLTTHGDGVFYFPNLCFYFLSSRPGLTGKNALCIRNLDSHHLVAGFAGGDIITINSTDASSQCFERWAIQNKNNRILDVWPFHGDSLLAATDQGLKIFSPGGNTILIPISIKELNVLPDKSILAGMSSSVELLNIASGLKKALFYERATCITHINRQYFWGTLHGAYVYAGNAFSCLGLQYPELSGIINHLDIAPDSSLWASTQQGVVILKDNHITVIKKEQGIASNMCKQVSFEHNTAWVSTDKGISRIDYSWNNSRISYSLSNITEEDGLTTNNVNRTLPAGNYIWAATASGISFFSKDYISHPVLNPRININKIIAGNESVPVTDTIETNYKKSKLLIELSGISYRSGRQIQYEYRLLELDSSWSSISNNIIEFPTLPYGRFTFEGRSVDRWGNRSNQPKKIVIINNPPVWETKGFRLFSYLAMALLFGFSFYTYNGRLQRRKEKEYQLKKKMHNLEMMALRAQMNPHFIFNCLTSIQYHIVRADTRKANNYLHKFSTLIRQILQHSTDSFISLREEIKILELYLELEKLRLGERMEYQILATEDLKQESQTIPVMIVQPYVENAIKHGIACQETKKGLLTIVIKRTGNYIDFLIEDNGPGIDASISANRTAPPGYMSMGAGITASRISTINSTQKQKIVLQVHDKRAPGHTETGTIVHISFPIITD